MLCLILADELGLFRSSEVIADIEFVSNIQNRKGNVDLVASIQLRRSNAILIFLCRLVQRLHGRLVQRLRSDVLRENRHR